MGYARDLVTLTKPRITMTVLITAAAGMKLAQRFLGGAAGASSSGGMRWLWTLLGTALVVGSANALNMWLERDVDRHMARTRSRPLPDGRLPSAVALVFGLLLGVVSLPMLWFGVNPVTAGLGAFALFSYVCVYTPLKLRWVRAMWIGAIPGAIPPLLGFSAVTGRIDLAGLALFTILFVWQIPHFLAITVFRADDYARAGLKVIPVEMGDRVTDGMMLRYSVGLLAVTVWPFLLGLGGKVYLGVAIALGAAFVALVARSFRQNLASVEGGRARWARSVFAYSIVYIVVLLATLVLAAA
ncbi:MAG: protoheme IX farnesyltransferase [Myxococcales bacterium]|nr:protoheme IX farnesyltransferase [Myxococcales bacterium]